MADDSLTEDWSGDRMPKVSDRGRVSVCIATYNGAHCVVEQLESILPQLHDDDEVIVVDDASKDATVAVVRAMGDPRIKVFGRANNLGYVRTFSEALELATGDYLLLSDQDDIWTADHVDIIVSGLRTHGVVATNLGTLNGPSSIPGPYGQKDWRLVSSSSSHRIRNIGGILVGNRPYYGCAMGFQGYLRDRGMLPFPDFLHESHDLWMALYGNWTSTMFHDERRTVLRRFHDNNQTPTRPRSPKIVMGSRLLLLRCLMELIRRRKLMFDQPKKSRYEA